MPETEPLKHVSVPLRQSVWLQLRQLAAARGKSMTELCSGWCRVAIAAAAAERKGRNLSSADGDRVA